MSSSEVPVVQEEEDDKQVEASAASAKPPLCSVLNTVIDHVMVPPTPLEEEEFHDKNNHNIRVPVVRVFGPLVRRQPPSLPENMDVEQEPRLTRPFESHQSACLHIHGAFPYLLARPVVAGPDGALHPPAGNGNLHYTNWDSREAVQAILPLLTEHLEEAVQAYSPQNNKKESPRLVRRLSVVMGRGFYTYCPGPPAPFVRIEYYDPSQRWKLCRVLEQGLEVPLHCHAHPTQYDVAGDAEVPTALIFACYEAHVPFTMQFFKDYNLAGLSYIHLAKARFRNNLPSTIRRTVFAPTNATTDGSDFCFLKSNTAPDLLWVSSSSSTASKGGLSSSTPDASFWTRKETSCDVELDVKAQEILNVQTVMRDNPNDPSCHWRAVPSLRELWMDERQRMSRLLPPQEDFLSHSTPPNTHSTEEKQPPNASAFTLQVKQGAPVPGTRLAKQGMDRLRDLTPGMSASFGRVLKEIVQRHAPMIDRVDATMRRDHAQVGVETSDEKAALDALGDMAGLSFPDQDEELVERIPLDSQLSQNSDNQWPPTPMSQASSMADKAESRISKGERIQALTQEYYQPQHQNDHDESGDHARYFAMSQLRDRGEPVRKGGFEHFDDLLDPGTLCPREDIGYESQGSQDDEDDDNEDENLEQESLDETAKNDDNSKDEDGQLDDQGSVESMVLLTQQHDESSGDSDAEVGSTGSAGSMTGWNKSICTQTTPPLHRVQEERTPRTSGVVRVWEHASDVWVEPTSAPPTRAQMVDAANGAVVAALHPMHRDKTTVASWTRLSCAYHQMRPDVKENWFPTIPKGSNGVFATLSRSAPTCKSVESWFRRHEKRNRPVVKDLRPPKRQRRAAEKTAVNLLPLDETSRKLIITAASTPGDDSSGAKVEEIAWQLSQPTPMSASQLSEHFTPTDKIQTSSAAEPTSASTNQSKSGHVQSQGTPSGPTHSSSSAPVETPSPERALRGMGNQGGQLWVEGGGKLKPSQHDNGTRQLMASEVEGGSESLPTPVSMMAIEIHIQTRKGNAGRNDPRVTALTPDWDRDKVASVVYVYAVDPGGGESIRILERGCIFLPLERQMDMVERDISSVDLRLLAQAVKQSMPPTVMGHTAPLYVECVGNESKLLLRIASIVRTKDPDMLLSWEPQGGGLGYLIERGAAIGRKGSSASDVSREIDLTRLMGRTPKGASHSNLDPSPAELFGKDEGGGKEHVGSKSGDRKEGQRWKGSGLGVDWDERVGPGAAAASISGRLVFSARKVVAQEVKHPNAPYLPAVVSSVLNKRIPYHDGLKLTEWYAHNNGRERWRVIHHKLTQACCSLLLFDALDIVGRSGEAARLSGVEFSQSFPGIRGSQFKVEGVLLRALQSLNSNERGRKKGTSARAASASSSNLTEESKSQTQSPWKLRRRATEEAAKVMGDQVHELSDRSYFFYSPSLKDTNRQEALLVQALTLQPMSGHHHDPVVVCDFTALYPSLVIAYNLCYSTCAGQLEYQSTRDEMRIKGRTTGKVGPMAYSELRTATVLKHQLKSISDSPVGDDRAYVAPSGTVYVGESVLKGVLPQVLDEILSTRAMLKKAAKQYKKHVPNLSPSVLRQLEARQLALKYVANVTYGYTSATFSGRCAMPLLADTIVECGRRTLKHAIDLANQWGESAGGRWAGCKVIYGDTDSVFVKLPGRSVQEGFQFGEEFCAAVTASNPPPVQLKLEKVYLGSIMQTMKRYCGMKFENPDQRKPVFEGKGIETIRRDQCALTQKVLKNSLVLLFQRGLDAVKEYLFRQWWLILSGQLPPSEFILTGRVRARYRNERIPNAFAALARRMAEADPARVVRHKERIALVIAATPGEKFILRDSGVGPLELLESWDCNRIYVDYYIKKQVNPALQRCFGLAPHHINVDDWYALSPKPRRRIHYWPISKSRNVQMITSHFGSDSCSLCSARCKSQGNSRAVVCTECRKDALKASTTTLIRLGKVQQEAQSLAERCSRCNLCFEDATTFAELSEPAKSSKGDNRTGAIAVPLANCTCIDCPVTYDRHRLRESEIEARAICRALGLLQVD